MAEQKVINSRNVLRIDKGRVIPVWSILLIAIGLALVYYQAYQFFVKPQIIFIWMALSPILPAVWSARRIIILDIEKNQYGTYTFILGFKLGKAIELNKIDHFVLHLREKISKGFKIEYFDLQVVDSQNRKYSLAQSENLDQLENLVKQKAPNYRVKYANFEKIY